LRRLDDNQKAGLSLLELLVSLTLLAFISLGLVGALGLGVRLYDRTSSLSVQSSPLAARTQLRSFLSAAEPRPPETSGTAFTLFSGKHDSLEFTTYAFTELVPTASQLVVRLHVDNGYLRLHISGRDHSGSTIEEFGSVLASNVTSIAVSYFSNDTWNESWDASGRLPQLVNVEINDGSLRNWPDFTVGLLKAN